MIVNTGGADQGVHSYWLFHEPFLIGSEGDRAWIKSLSKRWHQLLRQKLQGRKLDSTFDLARVLRPAGSISHKHAVVVTPALEAEEGRRLAESLVKLLTGGDRIECRRMREDFWGFWPTHTILLACNHKPRIKGTDWATWSRIRLIPFNVTIPLEEQDKDLAEKLANEAPGILAWAVRGCLAWQKDGLGSPPEVEKATADYRSSEDSLTAFLGEICELEPHATVRASALLKDYREWSGDKHLTQRRFGQMLSERGFERFTSNGVWYKGIALPAEP